MQKLAHEPFYVTGGTLPLDAQSYVTREADHDLFAALSAGQYCYVLNSRQVGKSSLMTRCAHRLRESGVRVHILDLQKYGSNLSPEQWYRGILEDLIVGLDLPAAARDYWRDHRDLGPLNRLVNILRDYLLPAAVPSGMAAAGGHARSYIEAPAGRHGTGPVVIFIDEVDYILSLPFSADELFAGVRDCYNRRSEDPRFEALTFCLLGVATPADLIRDPQTTPFNIGQRIVLRDFTPEEAAPLAEGLGRAADADSAKYLDRILAWTHGHPYLTQKLCRAVAERIRAGAQEHSSTGGALSPQALVDQAVAGLFLLPRAEEQEDNLLFVRNRLLSGAGDRAGVLDKYRQIWAGRRVPDDTGRRAALLKLSGIVRVETGRLVVRNRIYRTVFDRRWIERSMPDAELARQRAARRRGFLQAAGIALPIILLLLFLTGLAVRNDRIAGEAANRAEESAFREKRAAANLAKTNGELTKSERIARYQTTIARNQKEQAVRSADAAKRARREAEKSAGEAIRARRLAEERKAETDRALASAKVAGRRMETYFYPNLIEQAQTALARGSAADANDRLDRCPVALRGPEWYFLRKLAAPQNTGTIRVHDGEGTGKDARVKLVATSPDGRVVATHCGKTLCLWDRGSHRKIAGRNVPEDVYAMAFLDGGRELACGVDKAILLLDAATTRRVGEWRTDDAPSDPLDPKRVINVNHSAVVSLAVGPGGASLAFGLQRPEVGIRDLKAANGDTAWLHFPEVPGRASNSFHASCLAFSPDGSRVAAGVEYGETLSERVCVWDVRSRAVVARCTVPRLAVASDNYVHGVGFANAGRTVVAGLGSGAICVWSVDSDSSRPVAPVHVIAAHGAAVRSLLSASDGSRFASCGDDGLIRLWESSASDPASGPLATETLRGHRGPVQCMAFSPDERTIVSGGSDGTARFWSCDPRHSAVKARESQMFVLTPDRAGDRYLVCGENAFASVRDTRTNKELFRFAKPDTEFIRAALTDDGRSIAIAYLTSDFKRRALLLYSVDSGRLLGEFHGEVDGIECLAFSPDGRLLATGARWPVAGRAGWPYPVRLWDVASKREICRFSGLPPGKPDGHGGWAECLAFSRDGRTVVSGGGENNLRFWDVKSHREKFPQIAEAHSEYLRSATFSPDGRWLATGGADGTARLWRWNGSTLDRKPAMVLRGHRTVVNSVAFSSDGHALVTTGEEGVVKFWSLPILESGYVQAMISLPIDSPVSGAFFVPSERNAGGSGSLVVGLHGGQVLMLGAH
jgi:WD40 repeat protein